MSHANGYKVDLKHYTGIDNYVKNTFTYIGPRGDGYPQWKSAVGNLYCVRLLFHRLCILYADALNIEQDEGNHWDV